MLIDGVFTIRDSDTVKRAIAKANQHPLSASEIIEQKISFVMASLSDGNTMTREEVRKLVTG